MTHGSEQRTTAGAPAGAPSARQRRRRTTVLAALGAVVVLVVALALVRDHVFSSPSPVLLPSHPPRAQGYTGDHQDTGRPAPSWSGGVDTAWSIRTFDDNWRASKNAIRSAEFAASGDGRVFTAFEAEVGDGFQVASINVTGPAPVVEWMHFYPHHTDDAALITTDAGLVIADLVIDSSTGESTPAPWADESFMATPRAHVNGTLVVCGSGSCSGWRQDAGPGQWTRQWKASGNGLRPTSPLTPAGSGASTWLLVSSSSAGTVTILDPSTGELRDLPPEQSSGEWGDMQVYAASDGWAVVSADAGQVLTYTPDGQASGAYPYNPDIDSGSHRFALPVGGRTPTAGEVAAFVTTGTAPWADGVLRVLGAQESRPCTTYSFTPTAEGAPTRKATVNHVPYAEPVDGKCAFTYLPRQARVSADGAVLFTASRYDGASLVDLGGSGAFGRAGEARLGPAHWLYDDLVVSADPYGIAAFAPKEP